MSNLTSCMYCKGNTRAWCRKETGFLECECCGLVYRSPMPTEEQLNRMYADYYSEENISESRTQMLSSNTSTEKHAYFIRGLVNSGMHILDFGAGTGELASILRSAGFHVDGVEYSKDAIAVARQRHGFHFYSSLDQVTHNVEKRYDLIVGVEVIEHLTNPEDELNKLFYLLKPNGKLYLTTPNRNGLQARLHKCQWREAKKPFHLVLFNYFSLKHLLNKNGFNVVQYCRFSPLTDSAPFKVLLHRFLQMLGLYGGLRVIAYKRQ